MFRRLLNLVIILLAITPPAAIRSQQPASSPAALWPELIQLDGVKAYQAMRRLIAMPGETLSFLREAAPPATKTATAKQIDDLIRQLDSERFAEREKARQELERLEWQAAPALRKAAETGSSLELKRRLIARPDSPITGTNLRWHRAG